MNRHWIAAGVLFAWASAPLAQTLYTFDGLPGFVDEIAGPPGGPCAYPNGPVVGTFPSLAPFACPTAAPVPPGSLFGGVAVNKLTDTVWVSDGFVITEYGPGGAPITSFLLPVGAILPAGPVTGMGWDSAGGILWLTDGLFAAAIFPPPPPGCGALPVPAVPPFPVGPFVVAPPATGITWDPSSGSLFLCDAGGFVANVLPGGGPGPFPPIPVLGLGCPIAPPLSGITIDTAASFALGIPTYYVTDIFGSVGNFVAPGVPPPPSFYTPAPCFFLPAGGSVGLAFAAHGISYGAGLDGSGLPAPTIGSIGQSLTPSPGFATTIAGSPPGSAAILFGSPGFLCPAVPVGAPGFPLYITPPLTILGTAVVGAGGAAVLPTPIPAGLPPGFGFHVQWLAATPVPSLQVTEGLRLTAAFP